MMGEGKMGLLIRRNCKGARVQTHHGNLSSKRRRSPGLEQPPAYSPPTARCLVGSRQSRTNSRSSPQTLLHSLARARERQDTDQGPWNLATSHPLGHGRPGLGCRHLS